MNFFNLSVLSRQPGSCLPLQFRVRIFNKHFYIKKNKKIVYLINILFNRVNVGCGPAEERVLLTGLHAVADIFCECCKTTLGWKYAS